MEFVTSVINYLSANPPVVLALAGALATGLQYLINRFVEVRKLTNYLLGLIALPGVTSVAAIFTTGLPIKYAPIVAVLGQLFYAFNEAYKARVVKNAAPAETVLGPGV